MTIAEVKLVSYPFIGFGKIIIVDRVLGRVKTESHGARHRIPSDAKFADYGVCFACHARLRSTYYWHQWCVFAVLKSFISDWSDEDQNATRLSTST